MEKFNTGFNIPYYIFEEIVDYIELSCNGKCKSAKWANIKSLLCLAIQSNRITKEQGKFLEQKYCKEP